MRERRGRRKEKIESGKGFDTVRQVEESSRCDWVFSLVWQVRACPIWFVEAGTLSAASVILLRPLVELSSHFHC